METQETYVVKPIIAIERDVLEARIAKLRDELNAANLRAVVAEMKLAETKGAMSGQLSAALNAANSDKTAVVLAVAAFDKLEGEHNELVRLCSAMSRCYGSNSVGFHRAVAQLRAFVENL